MKLERMQFYLANNHIVVDMNLSDTNATWEWIGKQYRCGHYSQTNFPKEVCQEFLLIQIRQRRNKSRLQTRMYTRTECKQDQKILLVGQKLSEVAHSAIKHRE